MILFQEAVPPEEVEKRVAEAVEQAKAQQPPQGGGGPTSTETDPVTGAIDDVTTGCFGSIALFMTLLSGLLTGVLVLWKEVN